MPQTFLQVQKKIEQLQKQADELRASEIKGVIERIKVAIGHYGLTATQLGLTSGNSSSRAAALRGTRGRSQSPAFGDGNGNVWSGRGPRPHWLRDALDSGRSIEEFRLGAGSPTAALSATRAAGSLTKSVKKLKRAPSKVNYADDAGNSWTGRGPRPRWLKAALESGKSLEDFAK
jgi:DNA-binding protein H-NS